MVARGLAAISCAGGGDGPVGCGSDRGNLGDRQRVGSRRHRSTGRAWHCVRLRLRSAGGDLRGALPGRFRRPGALPLSGDRTVRRVVVRRLGRSVDAAGRLAPARGTDADRAWVRCAGVVRGSPSRVRCRMSRSRMLDLLWGGIGALVVVSLLTTADTTGDPLGIRRILTPEVGGRWHIGQRFRMSAQRLNGIELRAVPLGEVTGRYRLTLRALTDAPTIVRSADVAAADLVADDSYVFNFPEVEFSADVRFEFEMAASPDNPGRGVALRATRGEPSPDGGLLINGTPRWASLAFQTHTVSRPILPTLLGNGAGRRAQPEVLVGLLLWWVALRAGLRAAIGNTLMDHAR